MKKYEQIMTLMKLWGRDVEMSHNEDGDAFNRRDSEISPAWMGLDNALAVHIQQNVSEGIPSNPNIDVITSSPDLQWFLQSSLFSQSETSLGSLSTLTPTSMSDCCGLWQCSGPDQSGAGALRDSAVRRSDMHMSSQARERIRVRRERNRVAAARCRDRRRALTDMLQNETDRLEDVKSKLEGEIAALERERERLELVFEAHMPICKLKDPNPK